MAEYILHTIKFVETNLLYSMENRRFGRQWWAKCQVRKDHKCVLTRAPIKKGEQAYRPITNKGNRYERICPAFFEG